MSTWTYSNWTTLRWVLPDLKTWRFRSPADFKVVKIILDFSETAENNCYSLLKLHNFNIPVFKCISLHSEKVMKQKTEERSTLTLLVLLPIKSCSLEMDFRSVHISSLFFPPESSTLSPLSPSSLSSAPRLCTRIDPGAACTFLAWLDE